MHSPRKSASPTSTTPRGVTAIAAADTRGANSALHDARRMLSRMWLPRGAKQPHESALWGQLSTTFATTWWSASASGLAVASRVGRWREAPRLSRSLGRGRAARDKGRTVSVSNCDHCAVRPRHRPACRRAPRRHNKFDIQSRPERHRPRVGRFSSQCEKHISPHQHRKRGRTWHAFCLRAGDNRTRYATASSRAASQH